MSFIVLGLTEPESADQIFNKALEVRVQYDVQAKHMTVESFNSPIFASICGANLNKALQRLRHYKPLIGPMMLDINTASKQTELAISFYNNEERLPKLLALCKLVFFTQLAGLAPEIQKIFVGLYEQLCCVIGSLCKV